MPVTSKKRNYKKRTYRPRRRLPMIRKPRMSQPDIASCTETINLADPTMNTMYIINNTALDQFARSKLVAQAYQSYRITSINVRFKPRFDTYSSATPSTLPYLYYMIDKSGSIPTNIGVAELLKMGAKPIRFDDKTLNIKWRPGVITNATVAPGGASSSSVPSRYAISPWLATNASNTSATWSASTIDHLGLFFYVETSGPLSLFDVEITCDFQFKKPLVLVSDENPQAQTLAIEY